MTSRESRLTLLRGTERAAEREQCTLLDLSYGGMRFRSRTRFHEGETHRFFIELAAPIQGSAAVKATVCWVQPLDSQTYELGATFVESNKGWLGPDESETELTA